MTYKTNAELMSESGIAFDNDFHEKLKAGLQVDVTMHGENKAAAQLKALKRPITDHPKDDRPCLLKAPGETVGVFEWHEDEGEWFDTVLGLYHCSEDLEPWFVDLEGIV